jgi:putative Flp pilus-assembly TadE/G-like protein
MSVRHLHRNERGISLIFVSVGLAGFLAATTLAIDVGMMMMARSQAQNSADAGALAGATALVFNSFTDRSSTGPAVTSAVSTAQANLIAEQPPSILSSDVTFPNDPSGNPTRVAVSVYRVTARGNAIPTFLGGMFGVPTADVGASATGEASPANAETCVKPFMIPDKWIENSDSKGNPDGPWTVDSTYDIVDNKGKPLANPDVYIPLGQTGYTGYSSKDYGMRLVLRAGTGANIFPTMYYSWAMPSNIGGDDYRLNISGCNQTVIPLSPDTPFYMTQEPGNMVGPTDQGIDDLIAKDPAATFDASCNCVKGSQYGVSPRVTPIPLYDPLYYATGKMNGRNAAFKLANVIGFFVDKRVGDQVYGYVMPILGVIAPGVGPAPFGSFPAAIRLVQ